MLVILNDPAGVTGARRFPLDPAMTLQANIASRINDGAGCSLRINGDDADPLTDPRMLRPAKPDDIVTVTMRPEGLPTLALIALAALTVYAYASLPKPPSMSASGGTTESPNNRLTGQTNIARAYQAVPDVYGLRRVYPDMIQASNVVYVDNVKYVTEWLCVSRGKGTITNVQFSETPLADISGSSSTVFEPVGGAYPELGVTTLTDVVEPFECAEVNGQELTVPMVYESVSRTGTAETTALSTIFTVTFADGTDLAELKSRAGTGTADVAFVAPSYNGGSYNAEVCDILSYLVTGANVTFELEAPAAWDATQSLSARAMTLTATGLLPQTIGPFTLPVNAVSIRWNTVFLRGLKGSVSIKAEWWKIDGAGAEIGGTRADTTTTYTADTYDQRFYTTEVTPAAGDGRYRVEFTRTTAIIGDGSADVAKLEEVYALRKYATKDLPGVTVIKVTTKATAEATGYSERKFNLRWARHVRTLASATPSASRNFARSMVHLWAISGNDVSEFDTTALAAVNTALGEDAAVLRFDGSLDDADMSLGERLQLIANHARCQLWRDGAKWTVTRDQARTFHEAQFDYRNLAASGDSAISYAAHLPASFDGVEVQYVDETTQATKAYARLVITGGSVSAGTAQNPLKIALTGCVTQAQAENRAHLEARRLLYQRTSVQDTALGDASTIGPGSLVKWIDPNDFAGDDNLQAGEVLTIAGLVVTTSETLDFKGQASGRIVFTGEDGAQLGSPVVCTPGAGNTITLASAPAGIYVSDSTRQLGSRYAFAVGLTDAELEASGLYIVSSVTPAGDGTYSLALSAYDERMYAED